MPWCRTGHRLAGHESVFVRELANEKMVLLHKSSGLRATVEELFSDEGVRCTSHMKRRSATARCNL